MNKTDDIIRVVELFAGVGGFRIGLEGASDSFDTIWSNQWEPSTKHQDASIIYQARFGNKGHSNQDINTVKTENIPDHDLLVGGFPCQDYSVATTLNKSGGIEGKKGVLWWQIYRILNEKGETRPDYLFFENVDRIISSPAKQRGRDFALILSSLSDLGYTVEWRIINAADYGMPQRRRRTYILGYKEDSVVANKIDSLKNWVLYDGIMAKSFPFKEKKNTQSEFIIGGTIKEVSDKFNLSGNTSPFGNAGIIKDRNVFTVDTESVYNGTKMTLGGIVIDETFVPEDYIVSPEDLKKWEYEKGSKKLTRTSKDGFEYTYAEGAMAFPDSLELPSRTIITGEGGSSPSRFKHIIQMPSGKYRRLLPIELERLNMFPDNHTLHPDVSDGRRAFLMGNALVCGVIREIGRNLFSFIYDKAPVSSRNIEMERDSNPVLPFDFLQKGKELVRNVRKKNLIIDLNKNLLIGFVKKETEDYFLDGGIDKIYFTGKTKSFPSTVALNKLYYFMPYFKGKGIRDLYLIKIARIGSKQEVMTDSNDDEARLVLELEYLRSLPEYKPVKLNILHTYRNTVAGSIFNEENLN